ncbi:hypothetical protein GTA08_BOTSDO03383 [Botryosphaeria dothidea]|uniref:Uncharacterized protein n=1 Tax=Botryosphaeria dothidea TaxID=55169 RepID=A0A8H4J094_9PEZI|nr:hypothetical protein GTA08_BOTSDO03383 [Botryosphaeria dothidea]
MAIQAKDALEMLKSAKPNSGDDTYKDDFNKALKWSKYQKFPKVLFNIEIDAHKEPDDALKGKI